MARALEIAVQALLARHRPLGPLEDAKRENVAACIIPVALMAAGVTEGHDGAARPEEFLSVGTAGSEVAVKLGVSLSGIRSCLADSASDVVRGVPLEGECFTAEFIRSLLEAAADSGAWVDAEDEEWSHCEETSH